MSKWSRHLFLLRSCGPAQVSVTAPGYYHGRSPERHHAAAVTAGGGLYLWGSNGSGQCLQPPSRRQRNFVSVGDVPRPRRAAVSGRVLRAGCGLDWTVFQVAEDSAGGSSLAAAATTASGGGKCPATRVLSVGGLDSYGSERTARRRFHQSWPSSSATGGGGAPLDSGAHEYVNEVAGLGGRALAALAVGAFTAAAIDAQDGSLWTFGSAHGPDVSNGCLLGRPGGGGQLVAGPTALPRGVRCTAVSASSYTLAALGSDGVAYTWGDSDGGALGHGVRACSSPAPVLAAPRAPAVAPAESGVAAVRAAVGRRARGLVQQGASALGWGAAMDIFLPERAEEGGDDDGDDVSDEEIERGIHEANGSNPSAGETYLGESGEHRARSVSVSYTNGAMVTEGGNLLLFGGGHWEHGISHVPALHYGQHTKELAWRGLARGYEPGELVLAHHHAYIIARKIEVSI